MTQAVIQTTVTGMQGRPLATTAPAANQAYTWSGSAWTPTGPFLPLAGGVLSGVLRLQYTAPVLIFNDSSTSITAGGLWRAANTGGQLAIQANTATAGDFSTSVNALVLSNNGAVAVGNTLTVNGGLTGTAGASFAGGVGAQLFSASGNITSSASVWGGGGTSGSEVMNLGVRYHGLTSAANAIGFIFVNPFIYGWVDGTNQGALGWNASDENQKQNIAPITIDCLATIDKITLQQFDWLPDTTGSGHWNAGYIAQQLQTIMPEAVPAVPAGVPLGVDTRVLCGYLIGAVQQLSARVGALDGKTA